MMSSPVLCVLVGRRPIQQLHSTRLVRFRSVLPWIQLRGVVFRIRVVHVDLEASITHR